MSAETHLGRASVKSGNGVPTQANAKLICIAKSDEIKTFVAHSVHASVSGALSLIVRIKFEIVNKLTDTNWVTQNRKRRNK